MRIVIIDDEENIRQGLARLIAAQEGWSVSGVFADGGAALEFLRENRCDVIISDICMPGLSGLEMLRELRQRDATVPVILLSGYSDFHYAQEAIELGVVKYMTKPTNTRELIAALQKLEGELLPQPEENGAETTSNLLVSRAIEYMESNYQRKLSLRDVAAALYISPNYLSDLFKRHTSENFSDYLLRLRMQYAKQYLADVRYKVSDVAELVGFSDSRYFSSTFKRFFGLRPLEYRNKFITH